MSEGNYLLNRGQRRAVNSSGYSRLDGNAPFRGWGWLLLVVVGAIAITGLILAAIRMANPVPDPLNLGSFHATGNGQIDGNLVVGGSITNKKRTEGEMAITVTGASNFQGPTFMHDQVSVGNPSVSRKKLTGTARIPPQFEATKLIVHGSAQVGGNLQVNGTTTTDVLVTNTINAISASFVDLNVTGSFQILNKQRQIINVGPTRTFKTVTAALAQFNGRHVGDVIVKMDPGVYADNIMIGSNFTSSASLVIDNADAGKGLSIHGDLRPHVGMSYIDGMPLNYPLPPLNYVVTTSTGRSFIASGSAFDSDGQVLNVSPITVVDNLAPTNDGCQTPFANGASMTGKAVLIQRGGPACGFLLKAQNAILYNASVVILYQNSPANPVVAGGGPASTINTLTVMISLADATLLQSDMLANPSMTVSVFPNPNLPPFGPQTAIVNLVHPSGDLTKLQINVGTGAPDLATLGVVPGDNVTVVASSDGTAAKAPVSHYLTVASVAGNTLTFTQAMSIASDGLYDSITFLPNVQIMSVDPTIGTLAVNGGAGLALRGVALVSNPTFALAQQQRAISLDGSGTYLTGTGIVIDISLRRSNNPFILSNGAKAYIGPDTSITTSYPFFCMIGGPVEAFLNGQFYAQYASVLRSQGSALRATNGGYIQIENSLQVTNFNDLNLATNPALNVAGYHSSIVITGTGNIGSGGSGSPYLAASFQSKITTRGDIVLHANKFPGTTVGISSTEHSNIYCVAMPLIQNMSAGIAASRYSSFRTISTSFLNTIIGSTSFPYVIAENSELAAYYGSSNPLNVVPHTTGTPAIDHAFATQTLGGAGALATTLNPAATFSGLALYHGKRFNLINLNGAAHTIKLTAPALFEIAGAVASSNTFTFAAVNNTRVQLFVRSATRVLVEDAAGGSLSFVAKRDVEARSNHEDMVHAEAMYAEYLDSLETPQDHDWNQNLA